MNLVREVTHAHSQTTLTDRHRSARTRRIVEPCYSLFLKQFVFPTSQTRSLCISYGRTQVYLLAIRLDRLYKVTCSTQLTAPEGLAVTSEITSFQYNSH